MDRTVNSASLANRPNQTRYIYRRGYDPDIEFVPFAFRSFPEYNGVQTSIGFIQYEEVFPEGDSLVFVASENM